ncbi:MAG: lysophospholipid acyltransferase family protein, partial [Candidatus Krumholzibacteria bacterium]|nr:lysophospholipid acyltransferase family protein [Candidatus Krumholzibacteria bacterium]
IYVCLTTNSLPIILIVVVARLGELVFRLAAFVFDSIPEFLRGLIADLSATVYFMISPAKRKNVLCNLSGIGVEATSGSVLKIFRNHTRNIIEMFASSRWKPLDIQKRIDLEGREVLDHALKKGRGVILVTVHVGNWELAALFLSSCGYDLHVVTGVQMNRFLADAVKKVKETRGIRVIRPEHSYRRLFEALRSNGIVALLIDGDIFMGGAEVSLFGKDTIMPKGAVRLSKKTGAPIIGVFCRRLETGNFLINIEHIQEGRETASLPESESMKKLCGIMEDFIRKNSDQWCIFRRFWEAVH